MTLGRGHEGRVWQKTLRHYTAFRAGRFLTGDGSSGLANCCRLAGNGSGSAGLQTAQGAGDKPPRYVERWPTVLCTAKSRVSLALKSARRCSWMNEANSPLIGSAGLQTAQGAGDKPPRYGGRRPTAFCTAGSLILLAQEFLASATDVRSKVAHLLVAQVCNLRRVRGTSPCATSNVGQRRFVPQGASYF